jgi:hypothetical protein
MLDLGSSANFLGLPNELIEQILIEVHPIEVVHVRQESVYIPAMFYILMSLQICRRLHELVDGSIEIRLRIELAVDGWLLSERGEEPAETVLRQIRERRRAWEDFSPRSFWEIEYANTGSMTYEVRMSICLDQSVLTSSIQISAGTFGYSKDPSDNTSFRKLAFEELIPPESEGGRWSFTIGNLGIDAQEFSYSLDADALLLIESCDDGCVSLQRCVHPIMHIPEPYGEYTFGSYPQTSLIRKLPSHPLTSGGVNVRYGNHVRC